MPTLAAAALLLALAEPVVPPAEVITDRVHYCYPGDDGNLTGGIVSLEVPADAPVPAFRGDAVTTILDNGPSSNRIDLTFVGDGYRAADLPIYHAHVQAQLADLFSLEPYATYQTYFNVHQVDVVSNESGVDNDPSQGISRDTALDMGFWCSGVERLLCVSVGKARTHAAAAPGRDQIIAVANSTKYGGAGYTSSDLATTSGGNSSAAQVYIHELGHSLGNLADEYSYEGPQTYTGPEFSERDATIFDAAELTAMQRKWYAWIGESLPQFDGTVSAYEGCHYSVFGAFRPSPNSLMRNLGRPLNIPSAEALIIEFYKIVSPIDDASPTDVVYVGHDASISVTPLHPVGHSLDIRWLLDGVAIEGQTGETLRFCELQLQPGGYLVTAKVTDNTPWVRDETARANSMTETLNYIVSITTPPGDRTGDGNLDFSDVTDFLVDFSAHDNSADLAPPVGVFDFSDVLEFLRRFATPCS
ncbi:MAG: M64 family metallopeptidase [Phycisphaerales bacterium]